MKREYRFCARSVAKVPKRLKKPEWNANHQVNSRDVDEARLFQALGYSWYSNGCCVALFTSLLRRRFV